MNTYTRFTNVMLNKNAVFEEVQELWNSIAFYNYVQFALDESRKSPSQKQYDNSEPAYYEVLETLKPDLVIVWGKRLWYKIPDKGEYGKEEIVIDGKNYGKLYYFSASNNKKIPACHVPHPSSSQFNYSFNKLLNEVVRIV